MTTPPAIMRVLSGFLESGAALNLGSGASSLAPREGEFAVNVDIRIPCVPVRPFVHADAQRLPFREGSFRGLLAKDVLEHVDDVHQAVGEIRRTLTAGSRLVTTVPRAVPRAVWADPTHRRGFTKTALVTLMEEHRLEVELLRRIGAVPGVGRLGVEDHLIALLRVPGIGHFFGTNWLAVARAN